MKSLSLPNNPGATDTRTLSVPGLESTGTHEPSPSQQAPAGDAHFRLIDSAGETLEPLEMSAADQGVDDRTFEGKLTLKHAEFRVAVEGRDAAGYPYQRVLPRLIQIQSQVQIAN